MDFKRIRYLYVHHFKKKVCAMHALQFVAQKNTNNERLPVDKLMVVFFRNEFSVYESPMDYNARNDEIRDNVTRMRLWMRFCSFAVIACGALTQALLAALLIRVRATYYGHYL